MKKIILFLTMSIFLFGNITAQTQTLKEINIEMVFVKGGSFTMGCQSKEKDCDTPFSEEELSHKATVKDFYIGKYEVTQAEWESVMGENPSLHRSAIGTTLFYHPVEYVTWYEVQEFIQKLNMLTGKKYRLPTEAEWEYAARGGNQSKGELYAGSNNLNKVAWNQENADEETHEKGSKKPNELGIFDMSGNVSEWCGEWEDDESLHYKSSSSVFSNSKMKTKPLRGGSFWHATWFCNVGQRFGEDPDNGGNMIGFRLACESR